MATKKSLLYIISDEMTSNLFKNIARLEGDILITSLKLSRKQYYSRISLLMQAGLVKREKGKYLLTAFGKVIYNALTNLNGKLENALNNQWKLKVIDQMLPGEETNRVICALIDDQEIRAVLLNEELQLFEQLTTIRGYPKIS